VNRRLGGPRNLPGRRGRESSEPDRDSSSDPLTAQPVVSRYSGGGNKALYDGENEEDGKKQGRKNKTEGRGTEIKGEGMKETKTEI
jgi:hypothetical protein